MKNRSEIHNKTKLTKAQQIAFISYDNLKLITALIKIKYFF